jgi:hypothetical protein
MRKLFLAVLLVGALRVGAVSVTAVRCPNGGVQPQAVAEASGKIHLIYLKGDDGACDVFYVSSTDGGQTWSKPIRVNSQPGAAIATGTVRGAQIAVGKGNRIHVAWMGSSNAQPKAPGDGVPMLYARMNDAGDAFEPQRNLITTAPGLDGGGSVAADGAGNVYVAWHAPIPGERGEANRRIWLTVSNDDGKTFAAEKPMLTEATGVCGCCGMRLGIDEKGNPLAVYRAANSETRDIYVLHESADGKGYGATKVETMVTQSCPMSTASVARQGGRTLAAWETAGQVSLGAVGAGGVEPVPAPGQGNNRKHPSVAINKEGAVLLAWTEGTAWKRGGSVHWQVFDETLKPLAGEAGAQRGLVAWSLPTAVARGDGGFVVVY